MYEKMRELENRLWESGVTKKISEANVLPEDPTVKENRPPQHPNRSVALMMLEEMARTGAHTKYAGVPADFDWAQFRKDYAEAKAE